MSEGQSNDSVETLFVFEFLVEKIRVEKETEISDELALAVRLLDFPTLLIHPHKKEQQGDKRRECCFNKGKTCFFQMNLNSLHTRLSSSPLYAMVLDVKEEIPKLVGSSLISLAKVMGRILQDVAQNGISVPSSRGERGLVSVCSLTGEKIGFISLSYKLLSVGTGVQGQQPVEECIREQNMAIKPSSFSLPQSTCFENIAPESGTTWRREERLNPAAAGESVGIQCRPRSQTSQAFKEIGNSFDGEMNIFCPPQLYYSHSAEGKDDNVVEYKPININQDPNTFENLCSGHEMTGNKAELSPKMNNTEISVTTTERHQQTNVVGSNVDALKQLPLLNALLMELSQLNVQNNQHQPLSIHPNLAWIYRPTSTEPPGRHDIAPRKTLDKPKVTSTVLKNVQSSRPSTATGFKPAIPQRETKLKAPIAESKACDKPTRNKLVYGTTKTFNLRLKKISTHKVKRECTELLQNEKQTGNPKGKASPLNKPANPGQRKLPLYKKSTFNENGKTVTQKVKMKSPLQETTTTYVRENSREKEEKDLPIIPGIPSTPLGIENMECIQIPNANNDIAVQSTERTENLGAPSAPSPPSPPPSLRLREGTKSPGSSRFSSRKSSLSDLSVRANEEHEYADDFNSPEPSDVYSPDPGSTSEASRAHTPKPCVRPDSCSPDSVSHRKRTVLPVPPKASISPQRSLRSTHIFRPQTPASVVSFSSGDCDRDSLASSQTIGSRREVTETGQAECSLAAESLGSLKSESLKNRSPGRGSESVSSVEPQEAKDELGSLDLRREYQHISELVANKLPGYTM